MFNSKPAGAAHHLLDQAAPLFDRAVDQVSALAHQGANTVREGSHVVRGKAHQASDCTVSYIRKQPVKSMLMAVAAGAVLLAVLASMGRSRR